jgi:hypothetical protein
MTLEAKAKRLRAMLESMNPSEDVQAAHRYACRSLLAIEAGDAESARRLYKIAKAIWMHQLWLDLGAE